MSRLYMDTAILIWNGNGIEGKDQIQNFWTELPSSDHSVITLDAQPITGNNEIQFFNIILNLIKNFINIYIYIYIYIYICL
jgi:hypothetical protein